MSELRKTVVCLDLLKFRSRSAVGLHEGQEVDQI